MIRVRFAPSPTGYLHIGGLRTAFYNYLFAKKQGGTFILRVEDTDRKRYVEDAMLKLFEVLNTVGLTYDEGPDVGGNFGPYVQSERLELYKEHALKLVKEGKAYYCFCTQERLETMRKQQEEMKLPPKYDRHCASLSKEEITEKLLAKTPKVIRLKVPNEGSTAFNDLIRGEVSFQNALIDDQVLLKTDGFPTYHLAVVVDDHFMEITHIIRGEEWISSTPKHVLLYQAFGWKMPQVAHLPLLLNPDRSKLSKRQGDVAVEDYLAKGYLKEALINFVALLGWNPKGDQEIYSVDEMVQLFDLEHINKAGAVFDMKKLDWMNAEYLKKKTTSELAELCEPYLEKAGFTGIETKKLHKMLEAAKTRMKKLSDVVSELSFFMKLPEYDPKLLVWKKADAKDSLSNLQKAVQWMQEIENLEEKHMETIFKEKMGTQGIANGNMLWPLRVALSGLAGSPGPFLIMEVLGKEESQARIEQAIKALASL